MAQFLPESFLMGMGRLIMEFAKFGIDELDGLLGSGLVRGKSYLLETVPGAKSIFFISAFLKQGCSDGELSVLGTYDHAFSEISDEMKTSGFDCREFIREDKLQVLDFTNGTIYGGKTEAPHVQIGREIDIHQASNLVSAAWNGIGESRADDKGVRFALHTLSSFIRHFGLESSIQFVGDLSSSCKKRKGVLVATAKRNMVKSRDMSCLEDIFDGIIELSISEEQARFQRRIRVRDSPAPQFRQDRLPYEIVGNLGVVSVASKIVKDFESFKASMRVTRPGVLDMLGVRTFVSTSKAFANIHRLAFSELGYEKGKELLYKWGFESARTFTAPVAGAMKVDLANIPETVIDMFIKFMDLRGWGHFDSIKLDEKRQRGSVRYLESPVAAELHDYGKPVDAYVAGSVARLAEVLYGQNTVAKEVSCVAKGDEYCEFEVTKLRS
jgi:predicted hydrocarbon binding protein/KaiC/GvpD/RAD55 family RecA-like ATPase